MYIQNQKAMFLRPIIFFIKVLAFMATSLFGLTQTAYGQYGPPTIYNNAPYKDLIFKTPSHALKPLKVEGMFGESVDPYSGTLSLYQVDVDIPGNSDLPVRFARIFSNYSQGRGAYSNPFIGGWSLDIHHLKYRIPGTGTGKNKLDIRSFLVLHIYT